MPEKIDEPLYQALDTLPEEGETSLAVAVGVFDGVHRGHQALIEAAAARAAAAIDPAAGLAGRAPRVLPAALTFHPHPAAVFSPSRVPASLGTLDQRAASLRAAGAERVVVARFDRAFAAQTPEEFASEVLGRRLRARVVVVGEDFRFGCDRSGDIPMLRRAGERHGFEVLVVPPVFVDGVPARSTTIRYLITGGQVAEAARLLGRPYELQGVVEHGRQLGRTLGFPTANLGFAPGPVVPAAGVYAGRVRLSNGEMHRAAISIGDNPTVGPDLPRTVEAFLLDGFDRDIYGAQIGIEFAAHLRPMLKFDGLEALVEQMARDVEEAGRRVEG